MKNGRKHDKMYAMFGVNAEHKCRECCNFIFIRPTERRHSKCAVYGITHSAASDWNGRKEACGMYNREWTGRAIIELPGREKPESRCDGQIEMEV